MANKAKVRSNGVMVSSELLDYAKSPDLFLWKSLFLGKTMNVLWY